MIITKKHLIGNRRYVYVILILTIALLCLLYLQPPLRSSTSITFTQLEYVISADLKRLISNLTTHQSSSENADNNYVVNSSKCKIPSLDPFNMEMLSYFNPKNYVRCSNKTILSYTTKRNNIATLHVKTETKYEYGSKNIHCCYKEVTSNLKPKNFNQHVKAAQCVTLNTTNTLKEDIAIVICKNDKDEDVYKNVHAVITINDEIDDKIKETPKFANGEHLSILFVGIDSISRLNLIRAMPNTYNFLQQNDWVEFKGYNKIGDNTFPNLMGILTGMNESTTFKVCNPKVGGQLDKCNLIWYDYKRLGFITGYAEDEAEISTFNYLKKGFEKKPTDYYFRPYVVATENFLKNRILDGVKYCTGPESAGERIFNLARDFSSTFRHVSNFGFFWMNSFSHNEINSASRMDTKTANFLVDINRTEVIANSIVIFLSDHGFRIGPVTYTHSGWHEERLPFFYMSVPKWFQKKFPRKYNNLILNSNRLITPYDLYMTLQEILVLSGRNYSVKTSSACPKCKSLLDIVSNERSCEDAGIEKHWCTCNGYFTIPSNEVLAEQVAKFIIHEVHKIAINTDGNFGQCAQFKLKNIISAGISDYCDIKNKSNLYFLITFETHPAAVFQGTVSVSVDMHVPIFKMEGSISRLDIYSHNSWCVNDPVLKKYCYCHGTIAYISSAISSITQSILRFFY